MLMLALLPIGLLALRCVDTLATRFGDLLFNFFVLIISTLVARTLLLHLSLLDARTPLATAARPAAHPAAPPVPLISLLLILLYILFLFLLLEI